MLMILSPAKRMEIKKNEFDYSIPSMLNKTKDLIQELKHRYESRIIILDLPPLLSTDDAMVVMPQVDCVLMVVANGVSTPEEIEKAFNLLPKEKLVGVVYNKADEEAKAYYY